MTSPGIQARLHNAVCSASEADPGLQVPKQARPYNFHEELKIDKKNNFFGHSHLSLIQEWQLSVTGKSMCTGTG